MKIWRLIAGSLLAAVACAPSYAQQTKSQLNTYNNAVIVSNGVGAITANVLNPLLGSIINSACTIADSVNCPITALSGATANLPLIGAASGGGVTQGTLSGNTTLFPTVDAAPVSGNCAVFDSSGGLINANCSPSGSGTVGAGTVGQLAIYTGTTAVAGTTTGTGVIAALGNAINLVSGVVTQDTDGRIFNDQGQGNWLQTMMNNATAGSYGYNNAGVFLGPGGANDQGGASGAARTSTGTVAGGSISVAGFGFDDGGNNTFPAAGDNAAWGGYFECRAYALGAPLSGPTPNPATGYCAGVEIDSTNFRSPVVVTDPYNQAQAGATFGLHLASGGDCSSATGKCYDPSNGTLDLPATQSSAALMISPNGSTFKNGIVFGCDSIGTTDCSGNGSGSAMMLYPGLSLDWIGPGNIELFGIDVAATTTRTGGGIVWGNNGLALNGVATSPASGGGVYLCIDSSNTVYKKASCP